MGGHAATALMTDSKHEPVAPRSRRLAFTVVGWLFLAVGDLVALWRGYRGVEAYRLWRQNRLFDPSAAELYLLNAQMEAVIAVAGLAVAGVGMLLLFRAARKAAASDNE
jgi:hypothetical protein